MLKVFSRYILPIVILIFVSGCAVGNKYNYRVSEASLPLKGTGTVGLLIEDHRPYVVSGDKTPSFVGLQRSGVGIPYDVTTHSGSPFSDEVYVLLSKALQKSGYTVIKILSQEDLEKVNKMIVLRIFEWKSDIYMGITLHYDLQLKILNSEGSELAEERLNSVEQIGGYNFGNKNSEAVANALATKIGYLFNSESIKANL